MKTVEAGSLSDEQLALLDAARQSINNAHAPYSQFFVGAALRADGEIITGANVEDAAGSSICAERAAIARANAMGKRDLTAVAVVARGTDSGPGDIAPPCGACRQMLHEFASLSGHDIEVILSSTDGKKIVLTTVGELLPLPFELH